MSLSTTKTCYTFITFIRFFTSMNSLMVNKVHHYQALPHSLHSQVSSMVMMWIRTDTKQILPTFLVHSGVLIRMNSLMLVMKVGMSSGVSFLRFLFSLLQHFPITSEAWMHKCFYKSHYLPPGGWFYSINILFLDIILGLNFDSGVYWKKI